MAALSMGLATVEERVAALETQLGQHTRDAAALELKLTNANNTITAATSLLGQLAHEYTTWEQDVWWRHPHSLYLTNIYIYLGGTVVAYATNMLDFGFGWLKIN